MAKITRKEYDDIRRLKRNAQAKIRRLSRLGVSDLPQLPAINKNISRAELREYRKTFKSFTDRKNLRWQYVKTEGGALLSKGVRDEILAEQKRVNKLISKHSARFDKLESKLSPGTSVGEQRSSVKGDNRYYKKNPETFKNNQDAVEYLNRLKSIDRSVLDVSDARFKDNFVTSVKRVFGETEASELINLIGGLSDERFVQIVTVTGIDIAAIYTDDIDGYYEEIFDTFSSYDYA